MSLLRFHLDEDAEAHALVRALRDRGVDVTTTSEAGLSEVEDVTQLKWASRKGRAVNDNYFSFGDNYNSLLNLSCLT